MYATVVFKTLNIKKEELEGHMRTLMRVMAIFILMVAVVSLVCTNSKPYTLNLCNILYVNIQIKVSKAFLQIMNL